MIAPDVFEQKLSPLTEMFGEISESKLRIYYDRLKYYTETEIGRMVSRLLDSHMGRSFPLPAHVIEVGEQVKREAEPKTSTTDIHNPQEECEHCTNMGWVQTEKDFYGKPYDYFIYCQCEIGQKMKRGHREYFKRKKEGRWK